MTLFSRCDTLPESGRPASRSRHAVRRNRTHRMQALADFVEEIGILVRYATGRDYYDRHAVAPKE